MLQLFNSPLFIHLFESFRIARDPDGPLEAYSNLLDSAWHCHAAKSFQRISILLLVQPTLNCAYAPHNPVAYRNFLKVSTQVQRTFLLDGKARFLLAHRRISVHTLQIERQTENHEPLACCVSISSQLPDVMYLLLAFVFLRCNCQTKAMKSGP